MPLDCAKWIALGLASLVSPVAAFADDLCADLWFARAAILHQGGYCVASPLGEALFPAEACSSEEPEFPDFLGDQVAKISKLEADNNCAIDTSTTDIKIWQMAARKSLSIQPIKGIDDRVCVMKAPTSLRAAPSIEAEQLGWLERGDVVLMAHFEAGGADFASRVRRGTRVIEDIGWFSSSQCQVIK